MQTIIQYRSLFFLAFILAIFIVHSYWARKHPKVNSPKNAITCPKCHSKNLTIENPKRKQFSAQAALIGNAINGREGAMYTMLYEADKNYYRCRFCGHRFTYKKRYIGESKEKL